VAEAPAPGRISKVKLRQYRAGGLTFISFQKAKTNRKAFNRQENNTDGATADGRRILMPNFADREMSGCQCGGSPRPLILVF
jgi:hypothetical protein